MSSPPNQGYKVKNQKRLEYQTASVNDENMLLKQTVSSNASNLHVCTCTLRTVLRGLSDSREDHMRLIAVSLV